MTSPHAAELLELARLADQDKPFVKEQFARLNAAAAEQSPAGILRRAIHRQRKPLPFLERDCGLSMHEINEFLEGGDLTLTDFLRLAKAVGMRIEVVEVAATAPLSTTP